MKIQPRQHIFNKYNTSTVVTSEGYIGPKLKKQTLVNVFKADQMSALSVCFFPGGVCVGGGEGVLGPKQRIDEKTLNSVCQIPEKTTLFAVFCFFLRNCSFSLPC